MLLKFADKDFMEDRELKNIAPTTKDRYTRTLNEFQAFEAAEEVLNIEDVTASSVKKYLLHCQNIKKNNPTTKNTKLRVLKSSFNYLIECEYITDKQNPCKNP